MKYIKKKILQLIEILNYHDYLYHTLDSPIISDEEYDFLSQKLKLLKQKNNFNDTNHVMRNMFGFKKRKCFKYNSHFTPMLSLDNTYNIDEYIYIHNNIKKYFNGDTDISFFCELKFDGVALNLIYKKGKLFKALTRGNGIEGEDVTHNARMVHGIPSDLLGVNIPNLIEIRGEVCMLKKDFTALNLLSEQKKQKIFSNTRNAASGSLRQHDILITKQRNLFFYCYSCNIVSNDISVQLHSDYLNLAVSWGFKISKYTLLTTKIGDILHFYNLIDQVRDSLSLNIDGIVVKINSILLRNKIGSTNKFPKWAIALKFRAKQAKTKLLSVKYQIGRTGIITPVAILMPAILSGVVIKKASLYNKNIMNKLDLYFNDVVIISRSGDVIPKIQSVVTKHRLKNATKITFPEYCPSCSSKLYIHTNDIIVQCLLGINCLVQREKYIKHFFSKKAIYATGFSTSIIRKLVRGKYITNPVDCFYLDTHVLTQLKNIQIKSAMKMIKSLNECRKTTLDKFIYALGIPEIGIESSNLIATHFGSLKRIMNLTLQELKSIHGIGDVIAVNFYNFMKNTNNIIQIIKLIEKIEIKDTEEYDINLFNKKSILINKTIVFTGKFKNISREKLSKKLSQLGGIIKKNISSNIDLLLVGSNPGKKIQQAKKHNIKVILEDDIHRLFFSNKGTV